MNRRHTVAFKLFTASLLLSLAGSGLTRLHAQTAAPTATPVKPAAADDDDEKPFEPVAETPLPAGMSGSTTNDPRVGLKPGLYDAGEAAMGLKHVAFVKKASAFQLASNDPDSEAVQKALDILNVNKATTAKKLQPVFAQLAFADSDFAFQGTHLFQGNFYGFNIYDIANPEKVSLTTTVVCPGGQGDLSVYGKLLFMSVEMGNGRLDCGTQAFPPMPPPEPGHEKQHRVPAANAERFRGVRIFDISDIGNPRQVAAVQTCRGSHTHTLVVDPADKDNVYLYVSGTSFVRPAAELAGCSDEKPDKDPNTSLFRIDVIKVPLAAPQEAKVVSHPRVFVDARTGALNGLSNGGTHDKGKERPADTNQCHDITAYPAIGLAAGACSGNGILLDIKDPANPRRVDAVNDPNYAYWHSASFSNDGSKVVFTDEWGGGIQPRCRPTDPTKWGADAIFKLGDDKLTLASYYKMPAAQTAQENCVAHNGSLVPVPGRDIEVQAWYQGGVSVVDFTDAAHPYEIAYFDRGPIDGQQLVLGGEWSAYWYNGYIYGSEIARGLDVFQLLPSKFLSQNEIDAANLVHWNELNVQSQQKFDWPAQLVVARAYVDQLGRAQALPGKRIGQLNSAIAKAQASQLAAKDLAKLKKMGAMVEGQAGAAKTPADAARMHALARVLAQPSRSAAGNPADRAAM